MGLTLPTAIEVDTVGADCGPDLLLVINFELNGRYYYGSLLGLTDHNGRVRISGDELLARYHESQLQFPMDYKVALVDCDSAVTIRLIGGSTFTGQQDAALGSGLLE